MRRFILPFVLAAAAVAQQPQVFRIQPVRPVEELRKEALAAQPPMQVGDFWKPELVELVKLDQTIKLDIRYATSNNFLSTPMYEQARAFMQKPAAEAVVRADKALHEQGYGLLIHDAYRPWYVTKMFWDATPADKHQYVADPAQGSHHNQGCAVDLTLYDLKTGKAVEMPSGYDEMSERAHADYAGGTEEQRHLRGILRKAMEAEGFTVYPYEWWHFDYKDWKHYPVINVEFAQIPEVGVPTGSCSPCRFGSEYKPPHATYDPEAEFSREASKNKVNGEIVSWVYIGSDGAVKQVIIDKDLGGGYGLNENTVRAIRTWRFQPATHNGQPIPWLATVTSRFRSY